MRTLLLLAIVLVVAEGAAFAQKGTAEPDYYPMNYAGDIWSIIIPPPGSTLI